MMQEDVPLVKDFDADGNGWLNTSERQAARKALAEQRAAGGGERRGFGPPGGMRRDNQPAPEPGPRVNPSDVPSHADVPLYDEATLRTYFLDFENNDWEKELADFHGTDVEVPARLTVDGRVYENVGVRFRGMSSYFMVGEGRKRSLNLSLDLAHEDQRLGGYRTLNLLNSSGDPTMLRAVLFHHIARQYVPAPKACFVRLVINGESWGVYPSVQQFNKDFTAEWWGSKKGARWKAPGSPNGRAGLEYLGDDVAAYRKIYTIKSKDDPKAWADLVQLTKVLNQTPPAELATALAPILDVEGALRFLALENVFINTDGYWTRASDYSLYQDPGGVFHIVAHDVNETFQAPHGPGMGGPRPGGREGFPRPGDGERRETGAERSAGPGELGPRPGSPGAIGGARSFDLDPLVAASDPKKPLLSKLLAVPELRARYLALVGEIATEWLDWEKLGPLAAQYHALIAAEVKADTRKLHPTEAFLAGLDGAPNEPNAAPAPLPAGAGDPEAPRPRRGFGPPRAPSLKTFAEARRAYLLNHPAVKEATVAKR
jgi:spore coat protein CotH